MMRRLAWLVVCSAYYGWCVGWVHSHLFALRNLIKFPLLLLVTALVCLPCYHLTARFVAAHLRFRDVRTLVLGMMEDLSIMLASLGSVSLFLSLTIERPTADSLREYPMFLGLNVLFIAMSGTVSLVRRGAALLRNYALSTKRSAVVLTLWLGISLVVGGQWSWYLRPYFGVSTVPAPFCLGTQPDFRGARSFFEAIYHLVSADRASYRIR